MRTFISSLFFIFFSASTLGLAASSAPANEPDPFALVEPKEVCNVSLRGKALSAADLLPGMAVVHDAYTRPINLQYQGYAYIRS